MSTSLFFTGQIVGTPGVMETFTVEQRANCFKRHISGDWGNVDDHDKHVNDHALNNGERLLSSYVLPEGKLWIITEADRSVTTLLLPDEY